MDSFAAIAEPRRREIVMLLANEGALTVTDIVQKFNVTPPAISQHLKILKQANLVQVERRAQQRIYSLNTEGFDTMESFLSEVKKLWEGRLDRLDRYLVKLLKERKK